MNRRTIAVAAWLVGCGSAHRAAPPPPDAAPADAAPADDPPADAATTAAAPPAEHTLWALAPNRHMAHRIVDGDLAIDAGDPGFARYTRFGLPIPRWTLDDTVDGVRAARPGHGASLDLPLTADQATAARALILRVHATRAETLTVKIEGRHLPGGRVKLVPGWQTVEVPAEHLWHEGENLLVLESSGGLALSWLRVAADPSHTDDPLPRAGWNPGVRGLAVSDNAGLAWYVTVPAHATLAADVAGDCTVAVAAHDGDGSFAGGRLAGPGARVDLSALAGRVVRLELTGQPCPHGGVLFDARIVVPGPPAPPPPDGPAPKVVIFWVMDATRADKIPTFTPGARAETPNFDRLAKDGAVFRQHYVGGNESQVSHTSMFTSLYPAVHTVRTAGDHQVFRIPRQFPTIGQLMKGAGFTTVGVTGNGFIDDYGGYARGFKEFRNMMREKGVINGILFGANIVDDVIARVKKHARDAAPLFVFLGTVDNHSPWVARKPWIDRYDPGPYDGPFQTMGTPGPLGLIVGQMGCHKVPPPRDIERLRAIYDSAISYQDALIGDLLAALDKLGLADQTMLVVTADHGDELFEENRCGHGGSLRDSLARVPLIVHYPPRVSTRIVDEGTEGIDILPTILDTIGAPIPADAQGRSLRGLAAGDEAGWTEPSFASQFEYAFAVRLGRWKARVGKSARPMVLDMVKDPDERVDLSGVRPVERRYLTDHLGLYLAFRSQWQKARWGVAGNMTEAGAEEMER